MAKTEILKPAIKELAEKAKDTQVGNLVKKLFKNEDELAPVPNSRTNGIEYQSATKRELTSEELMQKYNVSPSKEYGEYHWEVEDTRAGRTSQPTQTPNKNNGSVNAGNREGDAANSGTGNKKSLTEESDQPNTQGIKPQTESKGIGNSLVKKAAITTGAIGLTTAAIVGIPQLLSNIPGADGNNDEGENQDGGNTQGGLWDIISSLFGGDQAPGGTYYLGGGNDPGEPDSSETSIINEAAEAISQYLPYILVGVGILVIILAITKNGKRSGKPSAAKKTAKKGGSHT